MLRLLLHLVRLFERALIRFGNADFGLVQTRGNFLIRQVLSRILARSMGRRLRNDKYGLTFHPQVSTGLPGHSTLSTVQNRNDGVSQ